MRISIHALREEGDGNPCPALSGSLHFYPRPPRGGRRRARKESPMEGLISIHALREEGDVGSEAASDCRQYFYPRPPRGGRPKPKEEEKKEEVFLSTPSARRATNSASKQSAKLPISIHALREEGDFKLVTGAASAYSISIHALREEGDLGGTLTWQRRKLFLSTPSARRATTSTRSGRSSRLKISIHALREEGDLEMRWVDGGRKRFLSTPSARRAT